MNTAIEIEKAIERLPEPEQRKLRILRPKEIYPNLSSNPDLQHQAMSVAEEPKADG